MTSMTDCWSVASASARRTRRSSSGGASVLNIVTATVLPTCS
jgi:hypothetical protein